MREQVRTELINNGLRTPAMQLDFMMFPWKLV